MTFVSGDSGHIEEHNRIVDIIGSGAVPSGVNMRYLDGTYSARPAANSSNEGMFYRAIDAQREYYSDGTEWIPVEKEEGLDIRDFGAKCDGITDDAAAIQACIDESAGLVTNFQTRPDVNFWGFPLLDSTVTLRSGIRYKGHNDPVGGSFLMPGGAGARIATTDSSFVAFDNDLNGTMQGRITLHNLKITGGVSFVSEAGNTASVIEVSHVSFLPPSDGAQYAVYIDGTFFMWWDQFYCEAAVDQLNAMFMTTLSNPTATSTQQYTNARFNRGGMLFDFPENGGSGVTAGSFIFRNMLAENCGQNRLLRFRQSSTTDLVDIRYIEVSDLAFADGYGAQPIVDFHSSGAGTMTVSSFKAERIVGDLCDAVVVTASGTGDIDNIAISNSELVTVPRAPSGSGKSYAMIQPCLLIGDGAIVEGDTTLTSASGLFVADMVGKLVYGVGIPSGTTIASLNSASSVELSLAYAGRNFTDGTITNGSPILTSDLAQFVADDVGAQVTAIVGGGIPLGTSIVSVTDAQTVVLSANATASAGGKNITLNEANGLKVYVEVDGWTGGQYSTRSNTGGFVAVSDSNNRVVLEFRKSGDRFARIQFQIDGDVAVGDGTVAPVVVGNLDSLT